MQIMMFVFAGVVHVNDVNVYHHLNHQEGEPVDLLASVENEVIFILVWVQALVNTT